MATNPFYASADRSPDEGHGGAELDIDACPICPVTGAELEADAEEISRAETVTEGLRKAPWPPSPDDEGPFLTDTDEAPAGLSNVAVASTIPRGDGDDDPTWTFPSPARFYNAMRRKGWEPSEDDMAAVVSIHNSMNELTWRRVLEYERLHVAECCEPKLKRFFRVFGSDDDWSPKARLNALIGYKKPFDRHDWIVDRCGTEVRYIIDFYPGRPLPGTNLPAIYLDVRPALDTPSALFDRLRMMAFSFFPSLAPDATPSSGPSPTP
ncbi:CCHL-1 protein [Thecamonas trahens ATCC 50062]|uniref:Holocytochrome c-type synthase n=1 Tax=Thecamonas trahens ATCC 50062 TaxID=461836 RepID=A0A0L0DFN3_THETB|nr:CCHL-1 protein [Thecamonas trahens ATCC 50062]KNC50113.1 CCHL-1 protein [Thecamonas trahens ATCC 50062]|eukprot:XP_013757272.1 CCHL-1 protein [Thecamonas trahens ATCC 50062]